MTPIATATNTPGKPIRTGVTGTINFQTPVVMTQDGQTIYIADDAPNGVIPFSTVTNTPGKMIRIAAASTSGILGLAIAPDGRTAYVSSQLPSNAAHPISPQRVTPSSKCSRLPGVVTPASGVVTPISATTGTAGKPINVGCGPNAIAVTPDGTMIYVALESGAVTPIATATDQPGKPIKVVNPAAILIVPRPR